MPTPAFISINAEKQGLITKGAFTPESVGNIYKEGHENQIMVQEIKHIVSAPTDPQSGQPTGLAVHKPLTFTCSLNKAVPLMYQALVDGELLNDVTINWYRTSESGTQELFFITELLDARIVEINTKLPQVLAEENKKYTQLIDVSLSYRAISWRHEICSTEGSYDWRELKTE